MAFPKKARFVVIGAGIHGLSTAWHLAEKLSHYVSKITGLPVQNQEEWQLLRYYPGQEYKHHYDAASPNTEDYEAMRENDRKRTIC